MKEGEETTTTHDLPHFGFHFVAGKWRPVKEDMWSSFALDEWLDVVDGEWAVRLSEDEGTCVYVLLTDYSVFVQPRGATSMTRVPMIVTEAPAAEGGEIQSRSSSVVTSDSSSDQVEIDLVQEVTVKFFSTKLNDYTESSCKVVSRAVLPIEIFAGTRGTSDDDSDCCTISTMFVGHNGSSAAEYCSRNLNSNILSSFQSSLAKWKKIESVRSPSPLVGDDWLGDMRVPASSAEIDLRIDDGRMRALVASVAKGCEQTDRNYLELANRNDLKDGAAGAGTLLYGPDVRGNLKLLCFNVGNVKGFLYNKTKGTVQLTHDTSAGEEARSFGDVALKYVQNKKGKAARFQKGCAALAVPFVCVRNIDLEDDAMLLLATPNVTEKAPPDLLLETVRGAMRAEFEEYLDKCRAVWKEEEPEAADLKSWLSARTKQWLIQDPFELSCKKIDGALRARGVEGEIAILVTLFCWQPVETLWGG